MKCSGVIGIGVSALVLTTFSAWISLAPAATPTFVVKMGDTISGHVLETVAGSDVSSRISLNNNGTVAFVAWWENKRGVFTQHQLIAGTGDILHNHRLAAPLWPSINDAGTIAFQSGWDDDGDGFIEGSGIFTQSELLFSEKQTIDGNLVDSLNSFDYPLINNAGEVAFQGAIDEPNSCTPPTSCFATGIFTQNRLLVRDGDTIGNLTIEALDEPFKFPAYYFSNAGIAAYSARTDAPDDAWAAIAGNEVLYLEGQDINGRIVLALGTPHINDSGDIVVSVGFGDPIGGVINDWILMGRNGTMIAQEGDIIAGQTITEMYGPTDLNNQGEVVFMARYTEQGGSEQRLGWFTQHRFLTDVEVTIDGLDVYLLGMPQINDHGDVAFFTAWDTNGDPRLEGSGIALLKANSAPVAICNDVQTVTTPGRCDAWANVDGGSHDPDGDSISLTQTPPAPYPLGITDVILDVTDTSGESAQCPATVTVTDNELPGITALSANPARLWPPNHEMIPVQVSVAAEDNCPGTVSCRIDTVISSEQDNAIGDGNTIGDWQITGDLNLLLRAERSGLNQQRTYTLVIDCADLSGNVVSDHVQVRVAPE